MPLVGVLHLSVFHRITAALAHQLRGKQMLLISIKGFGSHLSESSSPHFSLCRLSHLWRHSAVIIIYQHQFGSLQTPCRHEGTGINYLTNILVTSGKLNQFSAIHTIIKTTIWDHNKTTFSQVTWDKVRLHNINW